MQQHRELELMNSFREQFGRDWLQYRNHLETSGTPVLAAAKTPALSTLPPGALSPETMPSPSTGPVPSENESPQETAEEVRVDLEPKEEEEEEEQEQNEVEGGRSGSQRAVSWGELRKPRGGVAEPLWIEALSVGGQSLGTFPSLQGPSLGLSSAELCRPILVCPLEGPQRVRGRQCFLRVTSSHLFEVELQAARTLERLELQSLEAAEIESGTQAQREPVPEVRVAVGF